MHNLTTVCAYRHIAWPVPQALACPVCDAHPSDLLVLRDHRDSHAPSFIIACWVCGHRGRRSLDIATAIRHWNTPQTLWTRIVSAWGA